MIGNEDIPALPNRGLPEGAARHVLWPQGVAIFILTPQGIAPEMVNLGRYYTLEDSVLTIYTGVGIKYRIFNWSHVVLMAGLETIGATANANNQPK